MQYEIADLKALAVKGHERYEVSLLEMTCTRDELVAELDAAEGERDGLLSQMEQMKLEQQTFMTTHLNILHQIQVAMSDNTHTANMSAELSHLSEQLSMTDLSSIFTNQAEQTVSSIRGLRDELATSQATEQETANVCALEAQLVDLRSERASLVAEIKELSVEKDELCLQVEAKVSECKHVEIDRDALQ